MDIYRSIIILGAPNLTTAYLLRTLILAVKSNKSGDTISLASAHTLRAEDFHGFDCTEDCSDHQAGYDWAEQNNVGDASDCGGDSQSFTEGCEAYANEHSDDVLRQSVDDDNDDQSNGDRGNSGDK